MNTAHPYFRPCHGGPCTEHGMELDGFCQCKKADEEIKLLRKRLKDAQKIIHKHAGKKKT